MKTSIFSGIGHRGHWIVAIVALLFPLLGSALGQTFTVTVSPQAQPSYRGDVVTFQGTIVNNSATTQYLNGDAIGLAVGGSSISGVAYDLFTDDTDYISDFSTGSPIVLGPGAQWTGNLFQIVIGDDAPFTTYTGSFSVQGGTDATLFTSLGSGAFSLTVIDVPVTSGPSAPSNLAANAFAFNLVNLTWVDNSGNEAGFAIEESTDGISFTQIETAGVNVVSANVPGLQAGVTYYFRVRAFNAFQGKTYSAYTNVVSVTTPTQTPPLDFATGFTNSGGASGSLQYNGAAAINGSRLRLTDGGANEAGTVFTKKAQNIQRFETQFSFQLTNPNAEGIVFCIQGGGPTALGPFGGALGYPPLANSLAVKFDLFSESGEGVNSTGLYTNGAVPTNIGSVDLTNTGIDLHSGDTFAVALVYNGLTLTEIITDTVTNASFVQTYTVNIPSVLGSATGYVGFGGGTGTQTATQDVLTWSYVVLPTSPPPSPSVLTASAVSSGEIDLAWADNSNGNSQFIIQRSLDNGTFTQLGAGQTGTACRDTSVAPSTTYYYRVYETNSVGESGFTASVSATTPAAPIQSGNVSTQIPSLVLNSANLLPYALGSNSLSAVPAKSLPVTAVESLGGVNYLTLSVIRPHPAPSGITYVIECTSDLASGQWTPASVVPGYPVDNGDGTETLKARDTQTVTVGTQRFIRLRVTQP